MAYSKILIIDDTEEIREHLKEAILDAGVREEVLLAGNPMDGLELFHKNKNAITFVICDQYMPIENGTELCSIIKRENNGIRIYILTGDSTFDLEQTNGAADGVFYKPDGVQELIEKVVQYFRKAS